MHIDLQSVRFLIVEDSTYMRRIIRGLLAAYGAREIFEAEDGAIGIEMFESHEPDVIITDWVMPIIDGLEMTRLLRNVNGSKNPYVPIIMLTAHSERRKVIQARDAGVTEFLCKPISSRSLYERIYSVIATPRPFVRSKNFFGPDRRRFVHPNFGGPDLRKQLEETASAKAS